MKNKILYVMAFSCLLVSSCSQEDEIENVSKIKSSEFVTLNSGVVVQKRGDNYILSGDIVLSSEQLKSLDETGSIYGDIPSNPSPNVDVNPVTNLPDDITSRNLGIYPTAYNLWAMVRFTYNIELTATQKAYIKKALLDIESKTNVRFYNATNQPTHDYVYNIDYPYIDFYPTGDLSYSQSYVGRIGGRQQISLADFAFKYASDYGNLGVIEHEICHALGMLHEQERPDRDDYVTINWSNLKSMGQSNFAKRTTNYYYTGSYDFTSVMGYSSETISTDMVYDINQPMYTKKDNSYISQGWTVSAQDRKWLNALYLPYIARSDVYRELDDIVYDENNVPLTAEQRMQLQAQLNNGSSTPPSSGRIPNEF